MRTRALGALAAISLVASVPVADAVAAAPIHAGPVAVAAKTCGSGYTHARIGRRHHKHQKCLRAGEYCAHRFRAQYPKYGYRCNDRDRNGSWHLTRSY